MRIALPVMLFALVASSSGANPAVVPTPRTDAYAQRRHEEFLRRARQGGIELLFLGDSIMEQWEIEANRGVADTAVVPRGKPLWEKYFVPLRAANFSISGDRTQNLLWRLQHGELEGIAPRAVVLMIGTNNTRQTAELRADTAPEVAAGVAAVVREIRGRLPDTRILLQGIFPHGGRDDPSRSETVAINASIARLDDKQWVHFIDFGSRFLQADGSIATALLPDRLHPSRLGFEIWAAEIRAPLAALMAAPETEERTRRESLSPNSISVDAPGTPAPPPPR